MKIVPIDEGNVSYAVQLGKELVDAGTFGKDGPEFDWEYTLDMVRQLIQRDDYYLRMAYDDDDVACGFVAGHVLRFYFSPQYEGVEDAWFVRPGTKDRTKIAIALMRGFVSWALDEKKALLVQSGDIASIDTLAVDTLYRHMGFTRFGIVYKYARGA